MKKLGLCDTCLRKNCKEDWKEDLNKSPIQASYCGSYKISWKIIKKHFPEDYIKLKELNRMR